MFKIGDKVVFREGHEPITKLKGVMTVVLVAINKADQEATLLVLEDESGREDGGFYSRRFEYYKNSNVKNY